LLPTHSIVKAIKILASNGSGTRPKNKKKFSPQPMESEVPENI
jgi:hypothetical protein